MLCFLNPLFNFLVITVELKAKVKYCDTFSYIVDHCFSNDAGLQNISISSQLPACMKIIDSGAWGLLPVEQQLMFAPKC